MTDYEILRRVLSCIDPKTTQLGLIRRNGRVLLGVPLNAEAARRTLGLYQPQRRIARMMVLGLHELTHLGLHACILQKLRISCEQAVHAPVLAEIHPGTCGILLGSPEHRVRRAIASYQTKDGWEVAKISFGEAGARVLEQEARILDELQPLAAGVPRLTGLHHGHDVTVLRMPYLKGVAISPGESKDAMELLGRWNTELPTMPITGFTEWEAIQSALTKLNAGRLMLDRLSQESLRPVICHGDFARWNLLKQANGSVVVLDWEWGHQNGMPGIDLVHYILQDARLVKRLPHAEAITDTMQKLNRPECKDYLKRTGWSGDPMLPIIASLAWKQGAGHQENGEILEEILNSKF